jgi:hypothetical protein
MKKAILLLTILFSFTILFGCTEKVSWCENQYDQSGMIKDTCYYDESIKQNNPNLCYNIEYEKLRNLCLYGNTQNNNLTSENNDLNSQNNNTTPENNDSPINTDYKEPNDNTTNESEKVIQALETGDDMDWSIYTNTSHGAWNTAKPIALIDWLKTENTIEFAIRNMTVEKLTLTGIKLSNNEKNLEISQTLNPGATTKIKIPLNSGCEKEKYYFPRNEISIFYKNLSGIEQEQKAEYEIIGYQCKSA